MSLLDGLDSISGIMKAAASLTNTTNGFKEQIIPPSIVQSERLFTTRSRAINHIDERGQKAYLKILTTNPTNSLSRASNNTSLGTTSSGVLFDAVDASSAGYSSFLLTDVQCTLEEKLQVIEVFGDAEVSYYFGRQPIMFNFGGILIDSPDNNWFVQWIEMYSDVLRGSQLARNYELVKIILPNMTITGTVTRMGYSQNSARDVDIPFQFGFLAKQITPTPVMLSNNPLTGDNPIDFGQVNHFGQDSINQIKTNSANEYLSQLNSVVGNPLSTTKDYSTALNNFGQTSISNIGMPKNFLGASSIGVDGTTIASGGFSTTSGPSPVAVNPYYLFSNTSSSLNGIRASMFSPVYGVLSSLTKLITTGKGDVSSVIRFIYFSRYKHIKRCQKYK